MTLERFGGESIPSEQDVREEMARDALYECAGCGLLSNGASGWEYVEVNPHEGTFGWLCPKCLSE